MNNRIKAFVSFPVKRYGRFVYSTVLLFLVPCLLSGGASSGVMQKKTNHVLAQYESTYALLQETLHRNPEDIVSRMDMARLYITVAEELSQPAEKRVFWAMADREASIALNLKPDDKKARHLYAETAILTDNLARAMRIYEDLVYEDRKGSNTEDPAVLFGIYILEQKIDRGILFFRTKLRQDPNRHDVQYLLALIHLMAGDQRDAAAYLRDLADDPSTPKNILFISQKLLMEIDR
ncbi:MAG: hypothetical protein JXB26_11680 [Candidatus Aminicenantes bacterium]|nr:hypothetical protein [Candidatus Aminicenantes bacterium]